MEPDDPEKRIADLERQIADQKRIADLEHQLADAKASAGQYDGVQQPAQPWGLGQTSYTQAAFAERFPSRRRSMNGAGWVGATVGLLGGCIGGAATVKPRRSLATVDI